MSVTPTAIDDGKPTAPFDYTTVPTDVALHLQMSAERVRMRMERTVEDIIEIGRELKIAQSKLAKVGRDGQFRNWLKTEFEMSRSTAYNLMNVAEQFGNSPTVGLFNPTALYMLAAPSTPEPVRDAARKGEITTTKEVELAIAEAKEATRAARAETDLIQERLEMAEDEIQTRDRQQLEAQNLINDLSDRIRDLESKVRKADQARQRTPKTKEVRVEVPVVPPELEQQLAELQAQRDSLLRHAQELELQQASVSIETRHVHQKWQATSTTFAAAIRSLLADMPMAADTEQFDTDDWQGLAELQAMTERVVEELRVLRQSSMVIVEG